MDWVDFESDLLFDNTNPVAYIYDIGNDKITFNLKNNEDDLRSSEVDIEYEVYITDIYGNPVIDKSGNLIESLKGTLKKDLIDSDELSFENLPEGNYIITAESTKPYAKKLQGSFSLKESKEEIEYWVNDSVGSPLVLLTVNTQDFEGNCLIKWEDGLAPDITDEKFSNINSGYNQGECVISVNSNSEYTFQFFKSNPNVVFSKDDFEVGRSI